MVRVRMAPDMEFCMEIDLPGIDYDARDHDVQQHKALVYEAFLERIRKAFPECDVKVDTFTFGLDHERVPEKVV